MTAVEFQSVTKEHGRRGGVRDLSFRLEKGERLAILGPSGCGKTTALRLLAGLVAPDQGCILLRGETVSQDGRILVDPEARRVGMVFQNLALWPHMTARDNVAFGLEARAVPGPEREQRVAEALESARAGALAKAYPGELSGGEQQRVALARALALRPDILLLDEPLSSLDIRLSRQLRREMLKLHEKAGFTLIYVTHDLEEAQEMAGRVLVMNEGKVSWEGSSSELARYVNE